MAVNNNTREGLKNYLVDFLEQLDNYRKTIKRERRDFHLRHFYYFVCAAEEDTYYSKKDNLYGKILDFIFMIDDYSRRIFNQCNGNNIKEIFELLEFIKEEFERYKINFKRLLGGIESEALGITCFIEALKVDSLKTNINTRLEKIENDTLKSISEKDLKEIDDKYLKHIVPTSVKDSIKDYCSFVLASNELLLFFTKEYKRLNRQSVMLRLIDDIICGSDRLKKRASLIEELQLSIGEYIDLLISIKEANNNLSLEERIKLMDFVVTQYKELSKATNERLRMISQNSSFSLDIDNSYKVLKKYIKSKVN